jgi:hypothetical protein
VPAGWDCVQLESFPVQTKCYPLECAPIDGPITILPAPDVIEEPQVDAVDPTLVDPGITIGEPVPAPIACVPPVDCSTEPSAVHCLPVEECTPEANVRCVAPGCEVFEDGSVACPAPLPVECAPDELCLPPDCAVSSDGMTYCPEPLPLPCVEGEGIDGGCSSPGSPGSGGVACPDGVTDEECAKIVEEQRRNGGGSTDAIE